MPRSNCYKHCYVWVTNKTRVYVGCFHCGTRRTHEDQWGEYFVTNWRWTEVEQDKVAASQEAHSQHCWHKKRWEGAA